MSVVDKNFWYKKRVLITGHTGFKGSWLSLWLQNMKAKVYGLSLHPKKKLNIFDQAQVGKKMSSNLGNICNYKLVQALMAKTQPEIVIHMAAQPLVRYSYNNPIETYSTNVIGTLNILEAVRTVGSVKAVINVTTDKVYDNKERDEPYKEEEPLGGYDPYSSSKACSELLTSSYLKSFYKEKGVTLASVRAGNVIGGGDWSDDRLIPDIIKGFESEKIVLIRYPKSIRPWQHVLEPLSGYLVLAEKLYEKGQIYSGAWNFGPKDHDAKQVEWITKRMADLWGGNPKWKIDLNNHPHEENYLKLNCLKAKKYLDWSPKIGLDKALKMIIEWHQMFLSKNNMNKFTIKQIQGFMELQ